MTIAQQSPETKTSNVFQGGLVRTLVPTLLVLTFIPLILMGGASYLRSRSLLQQQAISLTQNQMTSQVKQMEQAVEVKNASLVNLLKDPAFKTQIQSALQAKPGSSQFETSKTSIENSIRVLGTTGAQPAFDQFILMQPDGTVLLASKPEWEQTSLKDDKAAFNVFTTGANQSFVLYNISSLYPNQLVLASVAGYKNAAGVRAATLIGFSEAPALLADLQSLSNLYPSADAYFVTQSSGQKNFIKIDSTTGKLVAFQPSVPQNTNVVAALDGLMHVENSGLKALTFNEEGNQAVLAQVAWAGALQAGLVLEIPEKAVLSQINSLLPFTIAIFLVAILAVILIVRFSIIRMFDPLAALAEITHRFSEGDFSQRADVKSHDEIGQLANSFNHMAEELASMYRSLEDQVEERTRQIGTAAEVAQQITSTTTTLDELLNRTVQLVTDQFNYYQSSIFLLDQTQKYAVLRASYGPAAEEMLGRGHRLEVGSDSIMGWVTTNNQPRIASDVEEDPIHLKNELLPETRSEIGIPIAVGNQVLGALDVQSTQPNAFGNETVTMLQTLASQIAVAIRNVSLAESTQVNFREVERLYRSSLSLASSKTKVEALDVAYRSLIDTPYPVAVLTVSDDQFELQSVNNPNEFGLSPTAIQALNENPDTVKRFFSIGPTAYENLPINLVSRDAMKRSFTGEALIVDAKTQNVPAPFTTFAQQTNSQSVAFLPVMNLEQLVALVVIGSSKQATLSTAALQPYTSFTNLLGATLDKITEAQEKEAELAEQVESTRVNFREMERLYHSSDSVASSKTKTEALEATANSLTNSPYPTAVITINDDQFEILSVNNANEFGLMPTATQALNENPDTVKRFFSIGPTAYENLPINLVSRDAMKRSFTGEALIVDAKTQNAPAPFVKFAQQTNSQSVAFLPVMNLEQLVALVVIGSKQTTLSTAALQPYTNLTSLLGATLDKITEAQEKEAELAEHYLLTSINQAVAESAGDLSRFFSELHSQIQKGIGDYAFRVNLYDKNAQTISVPYAYENGNVKEVETFPLGEGLSSILIRDQKPLLLAENVEQHIAELGIKVDEEPARSWMGAPMMVQNEPIGALIIQDLEHENTFDNDDLRFFTALANQVAIAIHNTRLLEESRTRAWQLETAAEIARDFSGSLNLDQLLVKAVNYISERLNLAHAAIFMLDTLGEFAVIHEATGEAGAELKNASYKSKVGSTSVIGTVAGSGEPLIVNNIAKDTTHYEGSALPQLLSRASTMGQIEFVRQLMNQDSLVSGHLLLGAEAEAAVPLKVGNRILGVLDAQSKHINAFDEHNVRLLQILADQMAVAVINSELFAETQEHLTQRSLLHHVTTSAASGTTLDEALESAVNGLQVTLGGDRVSILLMDNDNKTLKVRAAAGYSTETLNMQIPIGTGITGWAAEHKQALRIDNVTEDSRYIQASANNSSEEEDSNHIQANASTSTEEEDSHSIQDDVNTNSELAVPLIYRNDVLGVLNVESDQTGAYSKEDEEMLDTLGGNLATIIANARLLEQIRGQAERERALAEIARDISGSLNLDQLLAKAVNYIPERLNLEHAAIFMLDTLGEFAIIREATGEAGVQMKKASYKLEVGSTSVIGTVAGNGEPLIVNDIAKDTTHYTDSVLPHLLSRVSTMGQIGYIRQLMNQDSAVSGHLLPNAQAEAAIPLAVGDRILGVLDVQSIQVNAFDEDTMRSLQILADQMAVAVINSELFAETQEHLAQHRLLHHITTSAASGTTLDEALESAVNGLQVTLGGDRVSILLMDNDKKTLKVRAAVGYSTETLNMQIPIGTGITGWAAEHKRALRIDNVTEDSRYIQASANTNSELAVPLVYRNDVLGVLNVESEQTRAYSEEDEEMLDTLGGSLAAIIANARLLEQIRGQAERERALFEITDKIRRSTDMQSILATTASELTRVVGARSTRIRIATNGNNDDVAAKESQE